MSIAKVPRRRLAVHVPLVRLVQHAERPEVGRHGGHVHGHEELLGQLEDCGRCVALECRRRVYFFALT